jgi:preprotein translocase subunit SecD
MQKYITPGTVAGVLGFAAVLAGMVGKPELAGWFSDPNTAGNILGFFGGISALVAGFMKGING